MASAATTELRGWLLDVLGDRRDGTVVWFIGEDGSRHRLLQRFPVSFYAAGESGELRRAWKYLRARYPGVRLARVQRRELYDGPLELLAIEVANAERQRPLFRELFRRFPDLEYYDADVALPIRYHAAFHVFPLAYCRLQVDAAGWIQNVACEDSRWTLERSQAPLRVLDIFPSSDPARGYPAALELSIGGRPQQLPTGDRRQLLLELIRIIDDYDPDVIQTRFGDKWLFPHLAEIAGEYGIPFNPNREVGRQSIQVKASNFSSYGRMVHRDRQTLLLGRVHIDTRNSMASEDHNLDGVCEFARLTGLPLQNAARRSAGGGFTAMQVRAALQQSILVPLNKKRSERYKTAGELIAADNGGIVYQPIIGLHRDVAEIDFFSMYPSIMDNWNISPETVGVSGEDSRLTPGIGRPITRDRRGLVSEVLKPVLDKRRRSDTELKALVKRGLGQSREAQHLASVKETLKWFGWVSYGYQGFSGNRIGSIEAHESINAVSRELLLRAKEAAERHDFTVYHMYVDSLFVAKEGIATEAQYDELLKDMDERTGLTLKLEGIFRWVVFLPSKQDASVPVPNSYYGIFQDGRVKCRGIMARRGDTPLYLKQVQLEAIDLLGREPDFDKLPRMQPRLMATFRKRQRAMLAGQVPLRQMVISQRLSRNLDEYKTYLAGARAALQLQATGKAIGAGQSVRYLRVLGQPDAIPWDLRPEPADVHLDFDWYREMFLRMAWEIVQPYGVDRAVLASWLDSRSAYFHPEDYQEGRAKDLPLWEYAQHNQ